jgi:cytochrome c1
MRLGRIAGLLIAAAMLAACQQHPPPSAAVPPPAPQTLNVVDHGGQVPPPAPNASEVEEGYRVAIYVCSECHVVAADQKVPPRQVPNGPTFMTIANRPDLTPQRLREHLMFTHRTAATPSHMPNPELYDYEITDVIAYIHSLKRSP